MYAGYASCAGLAARRRVCAKQKHPPSHRPGESWIASSIRTSQRRPRKRARKRARNGTEVPPNCFLHLIMKPPIIARARRPGPILICRRCLKRWVGGDRIRSRLKRELKQRRTGKKTSRLVAVNCFGICPKEAVVLASGRSLESDEYMLVSRPRQVEAVLEKLLPSA